LEGHIDKTGEPALSPSLHINGKDLWQLSMTVEVILDET